MNCSKCGSEVGVDGGDYTVYPATEAEPAAAIHEWCRGGYLGSDRYGRAYGPGRPVEGEPVTETAPPPAPPR